MRVLVTGGAGFIGSHIVDRLTADGHTVLVVDDLSTGKLGNLENSRSVEFQQLDMGTEEFRKITRAFKPDVVSHVAAQPSVAVSMKEPEYDATVNIVAGLNVCRAAIESGCRQMIYITTGGALYGPPDYLPLDEDHAIRPVSAYGLSKWTLECYLKILTPPEMPLGVLRLSNVYGPRQDPHGEAGVVAIFAERMVQGLPVTIYGDGEQTRDFVYVEDVVHAHSLALQVRQSFTVNISSQAPFSVNQLFSLLASLTGYEQHPVYAPERDGDLRDSVLANTRAQDILGWQPKTDIVGGARATVESVRVAQAATVAD